MHWPVPVPSTTAMTPQTPTGAFRSASWPDCDVVSGLVGQLAVPSPATWTMTSQTVTGTAASTSPLWVVVPLVPVVSQSLEVFPSTPALMAHSVTGADALIRPDWVVDAPEEEDIPRAEAPWPSRPTALSLAVMGTLTLPTAPN